MIVFYSMVDYFMPYTKFRVLTTSYCTALCLSKISIHHQLSLTSFENNFVFTNPLQYLFTLLYSFKNGFALKVACMLLCKSVQPTLCAQKQSSTCEIAKQDCCVRIYTTISYVTFLMLYTPSTSTMHRLGSGGGCGRALRG